MPKISVIIPTYRKNCKEELDNLWKYFRYMDNNTLGKEFESLYKYNVKYDSDMVCSHILKPTIESLAVQQFKDFEIILCHKYPEDAEKLALNYKWIVKLIKEKPSIWHSLGDYATVNNNRNTGILHATGELLFFLDDMTIFNENLLQTVWDNYKDGYYTTCKAIKRIKVVDDKIIGTPKIDGDEGIEIPNTMTWTYGMSVSLKECLKINGFDECVLPNTYIYTSDNLKEIQDINTDDCVLSSDGKFNKVNKCIKNHYDGNMVKITPSMYRLPVTLTPNHPILTVSKFKYGKISIKPHYNSKNSILQQHFKNRVWKPAIDLTTNDYLLYPIPKEEIDVDYINISDYVNGIVKNDFIYGASTNRWGNKYRNSRSKNVINKITVDDKFLRLCGYYLSEGSFTETAKVCMLNFSFNSKEIDYINDVKDIVKYIFGVDVTIQKRDNNCTNVLLESSMIARFINGIFGHGAKNKCIPNWILKLPKNKLKYLIIGMWRGDGYVSSIKCERTKFSYATISDNLAYEFVYIMAKFGIIPFVSKRTQIDHNQFKSNHDIYEFSINGINAILFSDIVDVTINKKYYRECRSGFIYDEYIYIPISKIENINYNGEVYNLEVNNNPTYVSSFILHNCWDGSFGGTDLDFGRRLNQVTRFERKLGPTIYEFTHYAEQKKRKKIRDDEALRVICDQSPIPKNIRANSWKPTNEQMEAYNVYHLKNIGELDENWNRFMDVHLYDMKMERDKLND